MGLPLMDANKIVAELKDREDYELLAFLFYLVGEAADADMKTPFGALKAGQLAKPCRAMAEDFKLSKSTIHRRLTALKIIGLILVEGAGLKYRVTLLNFNSYRLLEDPAPIAPETPAEPDAPTEPKVKATKKKPTFTEDSQEYKLSALLFRFIQIRMPAAKAPNFQTWSYDADLMFRADGRTFEEAERVLRYSQKNTFWQRNILSIDKLRKHFDRLNMEMQNESTPSNQPNSTDSHKPKGATDRRENRFREVVSKYS